MLTLTVGDVPVRIETAAIAPLIARQIEQFGALAQASGQRLTVGDRAARVALKTVLGFYLDMVESDLDADGSDYPRPRPPRGVDYINWAITYVAAYLAHLADGQTLRLIVDADGNGGLRVNRIEMAGVVAALDGAHAGTLTGA